MFVAVDEGSSGVAVSVGLGIAVSVGGTLVAVKAAAGGRNVGGNAFVAVFSGVGGIISVAVGRGVIVDDKLQLNRVIANTVIPSILPVFSLMCTSALDLP